MLPFKVIYVIKLRGFVFINFLLVFSFNCSQNIDTDEQAIFWDGTSEICYPPLD